MEDRIVTLDELSQLIAKALVAHNTSDTNAHSVAAALAAAEAEGQKGHGVSRVAAYAAQAKSGKVDGHAQPQITEVGTAAVRVDAKSGFAYPALEAAIERLISLTPQTGVAVAAIAHSHHCGAMGYHVEKLAKHGMIGLMFSNSPKGIAPWGGHTGVFGTNPIAFAAPRPHHAPLVVDMSLSKVARGKIKVASQNNESIPEGWALDAEGNPTTDSQAAMSGTLLPMGDAKGAALVMMVEVLSAALTASHFGFEASSFFDAEGEPPHIGQLLLAIHPGPLSENGFGPRLETLIATILEQPGTRIPGTRRLGLRNRARQSGIKLSQSVYEKLVILGEH